MDSGSASQGVQGCPSPGMAERGEGSGTGNGGCNRSDGLPPVPRTPSQQGSGSGMDGQTLEVSNMPQQQPQQQQANVLQNVHRFAEHDKPGCRWSGRSGAGMSARKCPRNARTGTSMVWCAMDSPTTNVYATEFASTCAKLWLCE